MSEIRTSETTFLPHTAPAASALLRRVRRLLPVPYAHLEEVQVARYEHGQFYEGHYDAPAPEHPDYEAFMAQGGQRVATVLTYLSDCGEEGGGTHFPHADLEVRPRKGRALVFFPGFADGSLDPMAWHEALPAKQTKWVAQVWVRHCADPLRPLGERAFDPRVTPTLRSLLAEVRASQQPLAPLCLSECKSECGLTH